MTARKPTGKALEKRLNIFAVGKAILAPHIDMGQPTDENLQAPLAQQSSRHQRGDQTDYATLPPNPEYGNIYFPFHQNTVCGCPVFERGEEAGIPFGLVGE